MKIDFSKAFDKSRMVFYERSARELWFSCYFYNWIMEFITSPSFLILVNGAPYGFFKCSRGRGQGDLLSPYLFILTMEVLLRMMHKAKELKLIKRMKLSRNGTPINLLLFGDDLMVLLRASEADVRCYKQILECFNLWRGQGINAKKSSVFFSKYVRGSNNRIIKSILNL